MVKIIFDLGYHYRIHDQYYYDPIVYISERRHTHVNHRTRTRFEHC